MWGSLSAITSHLSILNGRKHICGDPCRLYITEYYIKMVESTDAGILVGYYITAYYFKMVETHM